MEVEGGRGWVGGGKREKKRGRVEKFTSNTHTHTQYARHLKGVDERSSDS